MSLKRKAVDLAADAAKKPKADKSITSFFGAPKSNAAPSSINPDRPANRATAEETKPIKFDKEAWVAKLDAEQKELLKLEIETLHDSWLGVLKDEVTSKEFLGLKRFLKRELETGKKVFPPPEDIYSWFVPSFLPSCLRSFLPAFFPSFLPSFLPSILPSFLPSLLPSFLRPSHLPR